MAFPIQTAGETVFKFLITSITFATSTKGKGTKVDTAELLAHIQPQLIKCYTPQGKGAAHPMRPLVMALVKKLTASAGSAAPSAAGA